MKPSNVQRPTSNVQPLTSNLRDLAALGLIALLVILFFWRILTPRLEDRAAFPPGDFTDQFWMFRVYAARAFAEGRLPLWSENFNSGHPFLADVQSAIFYPVSLAWTLAVVALRGGDFTLFDLELEAIFHFILAGAFTYLFARRLLESRVAALVAALTFIFGGYLTSYPPQQLAILETATWLPLILLLLNLGANRGGIYYLGAGLALGVAALAGHPQTFLFVVYVAAIYFIWEGLTHHTRGLAHYLVRFAMVGALAAGVSAAQWLPTLEYQLVSTRAAISFADAARGFPTIDPLQMLLPGYTSAFQSPLYIGILPLWLALFALFVNRSREKVFWALLAVGSLVAAFGFYAFAYALFYLFAPGFALFRGQERLALVFSFSLALLAGYGMRELLRAEMPAKLFRRAWALLPAGLTLAVLMAFELYIAGTVKQSGRIAFLADRAGLMAVLFLLASVLMGMRARNSFSQSAKGFVALSILLIAFELFSVNTQAYNAAPAPRFPASPLMQTIRADRAIFRVVDEGTQSGHFGIAYRVEEIGGISPLRVARYNDLLDHLPAEKLWQLLGVRYIITGRPGFANAELIQSDGAARLLRLNDALPRAWFAQNIAENANDAPVIAAMARDDFDPRKIVYVAENLPSSLRRGSEGAVSAVIEIARRDAEHWRFAVNAPADGLLVTSEIFYPGWRAFVDGIETPIVRANVALRAVPVRAGARVVEMIFDPLSVKAGIVVTLFALSGSLGLIVLGTRKK